MCPYFLQATSELRMTFASNGTLVLLYVRVFASAFHTCKDYGSFAMSNLLDS